jgi:hypothetical protein
MPARRFPPPWTLDEQNDACFIIRDRHGQALAYVYFEDEPGRQTAAKPLSKDEARRITVNFAKLPAAAVVSQGPGFFPYLARNALSNDAVHRCRRDIGVWSHLIDVNVIGSSRHSLRGSSTFCFVREVKKGRRGSDSAG